MPVFFLPEYEKKDYSVGEVISLSGDDAHHIVSVLRARKGEKITLVSTDGFEYVCSFEDHEKSKNGTTAFLTVSEINRNETESGIFITLYQGMPKGKKTDSIVQKSVELGVSKIVFVYSDRSVPEYENEKEEKKKKERLSKIADEASKQCGRGKLTEIEFAKSVDEIVPSMKKDDLSFFLYECEKDKSIKSALSGEYASVSFFIGPEGGISQREKELLEASGIASYSLGKRILRTETAPLATLSMILYEKEL